MNNYSDLIFLIAAIAIYGLLVNNTNRALVMNNQILTDSEIEYGAISAGQDVLEKARWIKYDEATESKLENLEGHSSVDWYDTSVNIHPPSDGCPSSNACKQIDVKVTSRFLTKADGTRKTITMSLIKTKY